MQAEVGREKWDNDVRRTSRGDRADAIACSSFGVEKCSRSQTRGKYFERNLGVKWFSSARSIGNYRYVALGAPAVGKARGADDYRALV